MYIIYLCDELGEGDDDPAARGVVCELAVDGAIHMFTHMYRYMYMYIYVYMNTYLYIFIPGRPAWLGRR